MILLDHLTVGVRDLEAAASFYAAALAPLGIARLYAFGDEFVGFGVDPKPFFWIARRSEPQSSVHVAFVAPDRATVDRFYDAAIAAGGRDNGAPAVCPEYHPNYYGAFVFDPDGHNVEAVCHAPLT